jgi:Protein of unknown function (DUF1549)/Protein of unknown function (DUF1553)
MKRITYSLFYMSLCMQLFWYALPSCAENTSAVNSVAPPVTQRFHAAEAAEEPNFQKHVVPLFGRLGCNGRACHGSFQGQGGFQLSLFGYDFKLDHDGLMKAEENRVVVNDPDKSLIITKPLSDEDHEGGKRYEKNSWEYHIIRKWIAGGAKFETSKVEKLIELEVQPAEILFDKSNQNVQLKAVAVWENGTREDVTPLCRFVSGSEQIAKVNENGLVTSNERGDSFLVVSYDKSVITVPVLRPVSDQVGKRYPQVVSRTKIDELVQTKLKKLGIVPSELCTDAEFLRRVSLDLCGTLPSVEEVEDFLANNSPNKRTEKINELLNSPAYAAWWATKFCDFTGNNDQQLVNAGGPRGSMSQNWYDWIYHRLEKNVSYDQIAAGIVAGTSRKEGQSYKDYCTQMSAMYHPNSDKKFADWHSMPYFWARNNVKTPEDKAIAFAYSFMGVRIQCAQCHKHPFDTWSKADFENFKGFFSRVTFSRGNSPRPETKEEYEAILKDLKVDPKLKGNDLDKAIGTMLKDGAVIPFAEIYSVPPKMVTTSVRNKENKKESKKVTPAAYARVLGEDQVLDLNQHEDPRTPLMDWLRSPHNPYFAKAIVNRIWANYFNVGIVEPPDDMSLGNPPSNPALLEHLASGFIEHKFDLKWVHRQICNSDTYQRSWHTNTTNEKDERNFSHSVPRRLPAEVAYDAIQRATANDLKAAEMSSIMKGRAIYVAAANANANGAGKEGFALKVFGRSIRESNCDCDRSMEASLLQTVYLQNDSEILSFLSGSKGTFMEFVNASLAPPKTINTKTRSLVEQAKVELTKAKLREKQQRGMVDKAKKELKDKELSRLEKLTERVAELEKQVTALTATEKEEQEKATASAVPAANVATLVNQAYLRTVSRPPNPQELERSLQFISSAETPVDGMRDLMWALLNTKEFIVNH